MKPRILFLIVSLVICVSSIALIMIKGSPVDKVSLDSVAEVGEGILNSISRVGRMATSVNDKEEMDLGNNIHEKLMANRIAKGIKDTPLEKYVNDVGNKIVQNVKRKDIRYKFHIVEGYYPNACSLPGGHVYITVGLLMSLKTEAELAAILAHEVVHVDAKHCIGIIQYKLAAGGSISGNMAGLVDVGYQSFFRPGYSEYQETEADLGATYLLQKAGYHPYGIVYAFERTNKEELKHGYENTSATPIGDTLKATGGLIVRYFASHPAALERIDNIKKYITDNKLISDKDVFYIGEKNFKERIPFSQKQYSEEFKKDYPILDEEPKENVQIKKEENAEKKENAEKDEKAVKEVTVKEVYTTYGRIASGMSMLYIETLLPEKSRAFKDETRVGYKDISVYDFDNKGKNYKAGIWIELEKNIVKEIRLYKQ